MSQKIKEIPEYMYPQNDFIFKRLFGYEGNEEITKNFVENIIGENITKLEFKNPYLLRESKNDKEEILDIKVLLDNHVQCDIEIQVSNEHDVEKRILDSWAKMYRQSIGKGKNYISMQRTIVIFITTFDIDNLKVIKDYKTKWEIQEEKTKIRLTDMLEIDIIELSKAKKQIRNGTFDEVKTLKDWITFLINPKELEGSGMEEMSEEVKQAYEVWQRLNLNEEEREIAEKRYLELASREYGKEYERKLGRKQGREQGLKEGKEQGLKEGREEGIKEGIKQGKEQGIHEEKIKIAKEMLKEKIDIETIANITKLTKEEIQKLK